MFTGTLNNLTIYRQRGFHGKKYYDILFVYPGIWLIVFERQLFGTVHSDLQNLIRFSGYQFFFYFGIT
jgi:hypothetical protein